MYGIIVEQSGPEVYEHSVFVGFVTQFCSDHLTTTMLLLVTTNM